MKRISAFIVALAAMLLMAGSAMAGSEPYVVKKGDTLSHIGQTFGVNWKDIARENNLANPDLIYPGQELLVAKGIKRGTLENPLVYTDEEVGDDPYKGTVEKALILMGKIEKNEKFQIRRDDWDIIGTGDLIHMVSGWNKVAYFAVSLRDGRLLAAEKHIVIKADGTSFPLLKNIWCGNWMIKIQPPPVTGVPEIVEGGPPQEEPIPEKKELKLPPEEKLVLKLPPPPKKRKIKLPEPGQCPPEHEPIVGAGIWGNGIAYGDWYYAEYMAWIKADCDSEYSYGVGFYLNGEDGDSRSSSYEWYGYGGGPQLGIKRYWFYTDKFGLDRPQQWTVKARLIWERLRGNNPDIGYYNRQDDWKAGFYAEYIRQMSEKWQGSLTAEGWYNFNRELESPLKNDEPSDRTQFSLGVYGQYKVNDTWQVRGGGGPFYQGWDDLVGLHLRLEGRYKEIFMFGPYANLFPYKTAIYDKVSLGELQTFGLFMRVEFGPIIRDWDHARRAKRIQKYQRELHPEGMPTPPSFVPMTQK